MPRSGRLRTFIREYSESPRTDKLSFIPPFLILILEIILILHALAINEVYVIILTATLVIISIVEMILVSLEMHEHYQSSNFDRLLTIRLDDFVIDRKEKNVKKIVSDFIDQHPEYTTNRNEIYHTTCQILETHKEEAIEKEITNKLNKLIKKRRKANVEEIVETFVKKFPKYKRYRTEIYEKTCQIMGNSTNKK
ncbi:MAG: hypothetical protein KAS76_02850 [Thermoplasmatales archaeon]|nr:hypothetical protein [Thermoplasmatales archaeon]